MITSLIRRGMGDTLAKDNTTLTLGIIYSILAGLSWIFLFLPFRYCTWTCYNIIYLGSPGGSITTFGNLFLIPSSILYIVFIASDEGSTSASVGFGLGVPGWVLGFIGQIIGFIDDPYLIYASPTILLLFFISLTVLGSILFARRHLWEETLAPITSTPTQPTPPPAGVPGPPCPHCNGATRYIPEYNRYYCDHCQKYV